MKCQKIVKTFSVPELKEISLNLLVLSDIQSKTQRYSVYNKIKLRKVANTCICEAGISECFAFLLDDYYLNCC